MKATTQINHMPDFLSTRRTAQAEYLRDACLVIILGAGLLYGSH